MAERDLALGEGNFGKVPWMKSLKMAVGQNVLVQFKHNIYIVAAVRGQFVPLGDPNRPQEGPLVMDRCQGDLREQDGEYVLTYPNPLDSNEQIDVLIDPESVCAVYIQRRISIPTQQIVTPR